MFVKYKFNITNDTSQMRISGTALMTLAKASSTECRKTGALASQRIYIITLLSFNGPDTPKTKIVLPYIDEW